MAEKFEIRLCNSVLAFVLGLPAGLALLAGVLAVFTSDVSGLTKVAEGGFLVALAVGGYKLLKWLVTRRATVEVWEDHIVVYHHKRSEPAVIPFAEVKHYMCKPLRDRQEVVFRLKNKTSRKISANQLFGPIGDFAGLVQALEVVAERYHQHNPTAMGQARSFFERPISTVFLGVATAVLLLAVGKVLFSPETSGMSLLGAAGAYLSYLGTWWAAADRRSQHES